MLDQEYELAPMPREGQRASRETSGWECRAVADTGDKLPLTESNGLLWVWPDTSSEGGLNQNQAEFGCPSVVQCRTAEGKGRIDSSPTCIRSLVFVRAICPTQKHNKVNMLRFFLPCFSPHRTCLDCGTNFAPKLSWHDTGTAAAELASPASVPEFMDAGGLGSAPGVWRRLLRRQTTPQGVSGTNDGNGAGGQKAERGNRGTQRYVLCVEQEIACGFSDAVRGLLAASHGQAVRAVAAGANEDGSGPKDEDLLVASSLAGGGGKEGSSGVLRGVSADCSKLFSLTTKCVLKHLVVSEGNCVVVESVGLRLGDDQPFLGVRLY